MYMITTLCLPDLHILNYEMDFGHMRTTWWQHTKHTQLFRNLNILHLVLGKINSMLFLASSCYVISIIERFVWSKSAKTNHKCFSFFYEVFLYFKFYFKYLQNCDLSNSSGLQAFHQTNFNLGSAKNCINITSWLQTSNAPLCQLRPRLFWAVSERAFPEVQEKLSSLSPLSTEEVTSGLLDPVLIFPK